MLISTASWELFETLHEKDLNFVLVQYGYNNMGGEL